MAASTPLGPGIYLTDSGLETDLIFHHGLDLPAFAAFPLLEQPSGRAQLGRYFRDHLAIAAQHSTAFVLEAPTWRANPDWGRLLGYDQPALDRVNEQAIAFLSELAAEAGPTVISGCIGPRADGYRPAHRMTVDAARDYHQPQVAAFARAGADLVNAMTINYTDEAIGIVLAAGAVAMPVAISFTVETDGRLPDGTALRDAITAVDAATDQAPVHFGVNCAHPDHLALALAADGDWTGRLRALRANASRRSHAELDEASELDEGDPAELAQGYARLRALVPTFTVLGGCCGTDVRHVAAIATALRTQPTGS
jgi:S-methylmethionine-dependent homocysteine/selenocysteine methylase